MLWLSILVLIGAALLAVLWPFLRGARGHDPLDAAIAHYQERKGELERQRDLGEIDENAFASAEAEQARHVLAAARKDEAKRADGLALARRRKFAAIVLLFGLPALSVAIYLRIGAPGLPDQPLVARMSAPQNLDVASALERIEAHLRKNPNDGKGFEVLAPVYLRIGRYEDAAHAYARTVELLGETPTRLADLGESLVAVANGVISADARRAFDRAIALDATYAKARFYLALAREQDGDAKGAFADLVALRARMPDGPGRMRVDAEIERFRSEGKAGASGDAPSQGGGSAEAIAALPPVEQRKAIEGMVAALDARLAANGGSAEEWQRLIQARIVLGDRIAAGAALTRARAALGEGAAANALDPLAAAIAAMQAKE